MHVTLLRDNNIEQLKQTNKDLADEFVTKASNSERERERGLKE